MLCQHLKKCERTEVRFLVSELLNLINACINSEFFQQCYNFSSGQIAVADLPAFLFTHHSPLNGEKCSWKSLYV